MNYFDIVASEDCAAAAAGLGFKKVYLAGRDALVADARAASGEGTAKTIISGGRIGELLHAIGNSNVVGVLAGPDTDKKVLAAMEEYGKILVFDASALTCVDQRNRLHNIGVYRQLLRNAIHIRMKVAIATLAQDRTAVLSPAQLIEISMLIGAKLEEAKGMVSALGERL